jgi:2-polyprenyl-3-methyl-5-hydroxy-6-metoxy-1,4-benzoquinol methylase
MTAVGSRVIDGEPLLGLLDPRTLPSLTRLVAAVLAVWPDHAKFLRTSFSVRDAAMLSYGEDVAGMIERLCGGQMDALCKSYRWMCEMVREEDLYFRRYGRYRLSTFAEACREVYFNDAVIDKYMKGLLLSQVMWSNHGMVQKFFIEKFLQRAAPGGRLLEVGPGHGLLLALAAKYAGCVELIGWDISTVSLELTAACLQRLEVATPTRLERQDVLAGTDCLAQFDSVVFSEVCEHLEEPSAALVVLRRVLAPGGRIFVNMPVNAPALDHIYLLTRPEDVVEMVRDTGFDIEDVCFAPASGYAEADARRRKISISVGVIARTG